MFTLGYSKVTARQRSSRKRKL